jgi:hypothetical protein
MTISILSFTESVIKTSLLMLGVSCCLFIGANGDFDSDGDLYEDMMEPGDYE